MEIETQIAADRQKAAELAAREAEKESAKKRQEIQTAVRRPTATPGIRRATGGLVTSGSVVKKPQSKRVGRGF